MKRSGMAKMLTAIAAAVLLMLGLLCCACAEDDFVLVFSANNKEYEIAGGAERRVDSMLKALKFSGIATDAISSDESLFRVTRDEYGQLCVRALKSFSGSQTLMVTVGGSQKTIRVKSEPVISGNELSLQGSAGNRYINLPKKINNVLNLVNPYVQVSDTVSSFHVYDDGGKDGKYSENYKNHLTIYAPKNYRLMVTGTIRTEHNNDCLYITGGDAASGGNYIGPLSSDEDGEALDIGTIVSGGNWIRLGFSTDDYSSTTYAGLDLKVTLLPPSHEYSISISNPETGGTISADKTKAREGQSVTLTAVPAEGYLLAGINVVNKNETLRLSWDGFLDDTAAFTMPAGDVTVTPVFTNEFTAQGGLCINLPANGRNNYVIPEGVLSFKVYDDGGKNGDFTIGNEEVFLTAPTDCVFHMSGSVSQPKSGTAFNVINSNEQGSTVGQKCIHIDQLSTSHSFSGTTSGRYAVIQLYSQTYSDEGLDMTVTVIEPEGAHTIGGLGKAGHGSIAARAGNNTVTKAEKDAEVTLTLTPDSGYMPKSLSVTMADGTPVPVSWCGPLDPTAVFTMPDSPVFVRAEYTGDLTASSLYINMDPDHDMDITIPAGVSSFMVYDDGGKDGDYSLYTNSQINLTAPDSCIFQACGEIVNGRMKGIGTAKLYIYGRPGRYDLLYNQSSPGQNVLPVKSSGNYMSIQLSTTGAFERSPGFELTVRVLSSDSYNITLQAGEHGSLACGDKTSGETATAHANELVTLKVTPDAGYMVQSVRYGERDATKVDDTTYSFAMPGENVAVYAAFVPHEHHFGFSLSEDGKTITGICENYGCSLTERKAAVTIAAPSGSLEYDGSAKAAVLSGDRDILAAEIRYTKDGSAFGGTPVGAGDYVAGMTLGEGTRAVTASVSYTIAPKPVTITGLGAAGKKYDGTTDAAVTGTAVIQGLLDGDDVRVAAGKASFSDANAGTDKTVTFSGFTLAGSEAANYALSAQPADAKADIDPAGVTLTANSRNTDVYDGTEKTVSGYTCGVENLAFAGVNAEGRGTDAGDYEVAFSGAAAGVTKDTTGNYVVAALEKGKLTIQPAPLTITVKDQAYPYDGRTHGEAGTVTYNVPEEIASKIDVSGLQGGDRITAVTLSGQAGRNAGESAIELTGFTVYRNADNYSAVSRPGKLIIQPKKVTVTGVAAVDRAYEEGCLTVALSGGVISSGLVDGDTVTVDLSGAAGTMADANAGENKAVTVTGVRLSGADAGNYVLSAQPSGVTVTISKAAPAVTAPVPKAGLQYTGEPQELVTAGTVRGGVLQYALGTDETTAPVSGWRTSIPAGSSVGTYYVWYKAMGDENHSDSDAACVKAAISAGPFTVSAAGDEHTQGDGKDAVLTVKGMPDDHTYENFTGAEMDGDAIDAGNYTTAKGSLILTLKASYLDTLSVGGHRVTIRFSNGSAGAAIRIKAAAPKPTPRPVPKTGDPSAPGLWTALLLLGLLCLGIGGLAFKNRLVQNRSGNLINQ